MIRCGMPGSFPEPVSAFCTQLFHFKGPLLADFDSFTTLQTLPFRAGMGKSKKGAALNIRHHRTGARRRQRGCLARSERRSSGNARLGSIKLPKLLSFAVSQPQRRRPFIRAIERQRHALRRRGTPTETLRLIYFDALADAQGHCDPLKSSDGIFDGIEIQGVRKTPWKTAPSGDDVNPSLSATF